jgi:hypothetical protein
MSKDELIEFLRENLSIEIDSTSEYTGAIEGPLYETRLTFRLVLDGETISEASP